MLEAVARAKGNCPDLVRSEGGVQRSLSQNSLLGKPEEPVSQRVVGGDGEHCIGWSDPLGGRVGVSWQPVCGEDGGLALLASPDSGRSCRPRGTSVTPHVRPGPPDAPEGAQVEGRGQQRPFGRDIGDVAQQEPAACLLVFDDPEDRLDQPLPALIRTGSPPRSTSTHGGHAAQHREALSPVRDHNERPSYRSRRQDTPGRRRRRPGTAASAPHDCA